MTEQHAHNAAMAIFGPGGFEHGMHAAGQLLASVADFRENNGQRRLDRRPRVEWWAQFLGHLSGLRPRVEAESTNAERRAAWFFRQIAPMLQAIAEVAGPDVTLADVAAYLGEGAVAGERALHDPATFELARQVGAFVDLYMGSR